VQGTVIKEVLKRCRRVVGGDIAMLDTEVQSVLKTLRNNGLNVVAIHHHIVGTTPTVIFLHYWSRGPAQKIAASVREAFRSDRKANR
jgi:Domain of Unknown Function (DUF1259)